MDNKELDQLFSISRNQLPMVSFEQTKTTFFSSTAVIAAGESSSWLKFINTLKNPFIMLGTLGIIVTTAILSMLNINEKETTISQVKTIREIGSDTEQTSSKSATPFLENIAELQDISSKGEDAIHTHSLDAEWVTGAMNPVEKSLFRTENNVKLTPLNELIGYGNSSDMEEVEGSNTIYRLTNNTTKSDMDAIKAKAEKIGLSFSYKMKRGKVTKINMEHRNESGLTKSSMNFSGNVDAEIGWVVDAGGSFLKFYSSKEEELDQLLGDAHNELELLYDKQVNEAEGLFSENEDLLDERLMILDEQLSKQSEALFSLSDEPLSVVKDRSDSIIQELNNIKFTTIGEEEHGKENEEEKMADTKSDKDYEKISFIITNSTSANELAAIQKVAVENGINFSMNYRHKKEHLTSLWVFMKLNSTEGLKKSQVSVNSGKKDQWSVTLVWNVDENGNAVNFAENKCQNICTR